MDGLDEGERLVVGSGEQTADMAWREVSEELRAE